MIFFLIAVLGLIFGSFLNVIIYRLPNEESIVFPGSKCPKCSTPIEWYHNIPVLSFIKLKGKTFCCHQNISLRYPIVELLSMLLWIWSYFYLDGLINQFFFIIIASCLLSIFFTDLNDFYIPLELNVLIFISALINYLVIDSYDLKFHFYSMISITIYFLVIMLLSSYLLKKETMGYGDIILIASISFWVGFIDSLLIIFFASLFSIIHWLILRASSKNKDIILPFGSTIALAALMVFILKNTLHIETNFF
tara:strand:- start:100 stop:852 length:753 start_codon:yes stop_codon:yes gene_type:complete